MSHHNNHLLRNVFMYVNWTAAALLSLSYLAGKTAPSHFTAVAMVGLIYPILFFVNLFFVVFWLLRKDARMLVSLLIILMGIPHIKDNFSFHLKQGSPTSSASKILSYNVQGFTGQNNAPFSPKLKKTVFSFLLKENPDIICLQEYSGNKPELLRKDKNRYVYFHSYYTRKGAKNTGLAIISKYKILNSNHLKFKGYRTFGISTDMVINKDTLRLFNVHLASISLEQADLDLLTSTPAQNWQKEKVRQHLSEIYYKLQKAFRLREQQLNLVLKQIKSSPYPVVLCGDFNDTPSSNAYHRVAGLLTDAFVKQGLGMSATYAGPLPYLRIDYFFASLHIKIITYKRYKLRSSDHFPISMTFKIDDNKKKSTN